MTGSKTSDASARETRRDLTSQLMARAGRQPLRRSAAKAIVSLARAAAEIAAALARGSYDNGLGVASDGTNADGDQQKSLDVIANNLVIEALKDTPTAYYASEEEDDVLTLARNGLLAVAVDPLDGSSNIDTNAPVGTIFSIYPVAPEGATASFLRPASEQIAAGYFVYGAHTALVLTTGAGVEIYVLDRAAATFMLVSEELRISQASAEFAINASNYRHWHAPVRAFIDDCLAGAEGSRGRDFNMRWVASLVAETHRIMVRGGVFLYPADAREGYEMGRLRHLYEAAPIAFLVEQAGGRASDGYKPILGNTPASLHVRTPLVFGSAENVETIESYHQGPDRGREKPPLFRSRGLFSA
jgi:fructose-1,6-bisphosphatase I